MKVCMILEGSYPYVQGGVSSWMHNYIKSFPDIEFILWCISDKSSKKGKFKYEIPSNVIEIHELSLSDSLKLQGKRGKVNLTKDEYIELKNFISGEAVDWNTLFNLFQNKKMNPISLLMSKPILDILIDICKEHHDYIPFTDFFHTYRSMLLPVLYIFSSDIPKADIYHSTATGYSGICGSIAKWKYNKPYILTEHGIYTREREEELLRAKWVLANFRQMWINLFVTLSNCAYDYADKVTALFSRANKIQNELGCSLDKLSVIGNGVNFEKFQNIKIKEADDYIDIAAIVRISKIKDIKTLIYGFAEVHAKYSKVRMHVLGPIEDKEYYEECLNLVKQLALSNITFPGRVNIIEYLEKIDFTILTSISEGQPLAILEAFAARRPCIATDVGCCQELLYGDINISSNEKVDNIGKAGILVPPMSKDELAYAMQTLIESPKLIKEMGIIASKRVDYFYRQEDSIKKYELLYEEVLNGWDRI